GLIRMHELDRSARIAHHHRIGQSVQRPEDGPLAVLVQRLEREHPASLIVERMLDLALPMIKIRQDAVIPPASHPAHDVEELLAKAPEVHEDHDGWKRSVSFGMGYEGVHRTFGRRNVDQLLAHLLALPRTCPSPSQSEAVLFKE